MVKDVQHGDQNSTAGILNKNTMRTAYLNENRERKLSLKLATRVLPRSFPCGAKGRIPDGSSHAKRTDKKKVREKVRRGDAIGRSHKRFWRKKKLTTGPDIGGGKVGFAAC